MFGILRKYKDWLNNRGIRKAERIENRRLSRTLKKRDIPYTHCKNCGTELTGIYCHQCGQHALELDQSFWKYIYTQISLAYQFDNRVFLTLWHLFRRPGFLTNEYLAGKINSYVHPIKLNRFLLIISIAIFLIFSASQRITSAFGDLVRGEVVAPVMLMDGINADTDYMDELFLSDRINVVLIAPSEAVEPFPHMMHIIKSHLNPEQSAIDTFIVNIPARFIEDGIIVEEETGEYHFTYDLEVHQKYSLIDDAFWEKLIELFFRYFTMIVLVMTPVLAFIVWLLNIRKGGRYMFHYIFSLHYTAFGVIFFVMYLMIYQVAGLDIPSPLLIPAIALTTYLTTAIKTVYKDKFWTISLFKSIFINIFYSLVILVIMIIVMFIVAENGIN